MMWLQASPGPPPGAELIRLRSLNMLVDRFMNELLKNLVQLQTLEWDDASDTRSKALIAELRGKIPAQILGHYDRLMARGKKGIVPVRGQTCTGCHMQVPVAVVMTLMKAADVQLCDNCGRYLYLEEQSQPDAAPEVSKTKATPKRRRKKRNPGQDDGESAG